MLLDHNRLPTANPRPLRAARRPWLALLSALLDLGQGKAELLHHSEQPWASATFAGTRHAVRLMFNGLDAIAAGEALVDALPDHEFNLPGQLVADAAVTNIDQTVVPEPRMILEIAVLLLQDN
jgi:hypothetical protein